MPITKEFIASLLWEEESATLDFKREQYRFSRATDQAKSELLKDILAFANAFRRNDAFILIGVSEAKGGRSQVMGVTDHLDDADLQLFVNSNTQWPVTFSYRTMKLDGLQVGIIHIPRQQRPVYLRKRFGKLEAGAVYLRRGSATALATPRRDRRHGR